MHADPAISIIIRCRNEERHIGRLLSGIQEQDFLNYEIILVDSGSTDATVMIAQHYSVKIVRIEPEHFSFGYALNKGGDVARGDILVFASAHVYPVYKNWLSMLIAPFCDERVALVYGRQQGAECSRFSEHRLFEQWFPPLPCPDQSHAFCNNANAAVRRSVWRRQRYDETLTGLEDIAWARVAQQMRWKIAYQSGAMVVHVHEETFSQIFTRYYREAAAMKRIYPDETFSVVTLVGAILGHVFSDWHIAYKEDQFRKHWLDIIRFRCCQFWGTFRGYRTREVMLSDMRERFYYPEGVRKKFNNIVMPAEQLQIDYSKVPKESLHD